MRIRRTAGADSASSIIVTGNDSVRSMNRPTVASMKPPEKPETMPSTTPMSTVKNVAVSAMPSDQVMASISRDNRSRPVDGSTPSGWSQLMPPKLPCGLTPSSDKRSWWNSLGLSTPTATRIGAAMAHSTMMVEPTNEIIDSLSERNRATASCKGERPATLVAPSNEASAAASSPWASRSEVSDTWSPPAGWAGGTVPHRLSALYVTQAAPQVARR